ncbi:ethanolamine ammonia-lyase subunit EutC [Acidihalobacter prosperus]|uniref:Ethanolamine ammonia-lyase small subunit n=1 Tax=Acidihalobacter prosperus TaxID=160660 RepID=A0A1A6C2L6_9GAMM|nr:ethanolamine ammonia-lyase subunit EutC [Acidihalobacter prosperus]OBS08790.1 ethanolamine ammonia-lyase [Acidihalobacter prosperus]
MSGEGRRLPGQADPWRGLRRFTDARIALGRVGGSQPTEAVLDFRLAHAKARDAVHRPLDADALCARLAPLGLPVLRAASRAPDRATYLQRPDLGRALAPEAAARLAGEPSAGYDVVFVLGDGLSALAVERHAPSLLEAVLTPLRAQGWRIGPLVVAEQARVALGDEAGQALNASLVVVLIGERPGLSSPDSLGIYLTYAPRPGRLNSERNCISNVRPEGLPCSTAAHKLVYLMSAAKRRALSGIALKDESVKQPEMETDPQVPDARRLKGDA